MSGTRARDVATLVVCLVSLSALFRYGCSAPETLTAEVWTGSVFSQGVELRVLDPWALPGGVVPLRLRARGAEGAAGIRTASVRLEDGAAVSARGRGADVLPQHLFGRHRVRDDIVPLWVRVPRHARPGARLTLHAAVDVSFARPGRPVRWVRHRANHTLRVIVFSPGSRLVARCLYALGAFVALGLVYALAVAFFRRPRALGGQPTGDALRDLVVFFVAFGAVVGLGVLGYWAFARPLSAALCSTSGALSALLVLLWLSVLAAAGYAGVARRRRGY